MQNTPRERIAVIIGAGPAGLTAAYELLERSDIKPIVLEVSDFMGGIARTINHNGNRIDIGGHRFFSKSDRVMDWWLNILPLQKLPDSARTITYHQRSRDVAPQTEGPDPESTDRVMLVRQRRSRIYFGRKFFSYPVTLSLDTLKNLGIVRSFKIGVSYLWSTLFPIRPERNLEEFFINRFGRELYRTFFQSYTEKVWGIECRQISAEWGSQRVKGLSITRAIVHFLRKSFRSGKRDIAQKQTETSLIEQFLYPKYGPGQMWDEVARVIRDRGGEILTRHRVIRILTDATHTKVRGVAAVDQNGAETVIEADYVFSSMPVRHLIRDLEAPVPESVKKIAEGLVYREFITVGLLLKDLKAHERDGSPIRDNWIYIQEPDVLVGRMQIFNNWSPYMVADRTRTWIGLEYFCYATDPMWQLPDAEMSRLATEEMARIGIIRAEDVLDSVVIRMPKTYPAYFGTYDRFNEVREFVDRFDNLFLIGRNGMHRYNNQDHSMLTAMVAVDNILAGITDKTNIWEINTEEDYHEEN